MIVVDVSDVYNPIHVNTITAPGWAYELEIADGCAYIYFSSQVLIVDITDLMNLTELGSLDIQEPVLEIAVRDTLAYLAVDDEGLVILDVSDPSSPAQISSYYIEYGLSTIRVIDDIAYACGCDFLVFDVADPLNLRIVGRTDWGAVDMAISGNLAYIAATYTGFGVIDISNSENPVNLDFNDFNGYEYGCALSGNYAYIAAWGSGMRVIDVSHPYNIFEYTCYDLEGCVDDVYVLGVT